MCCYCYDTVINIIILKRALVTSLRVVGVFSCWNGTVLVGTRINVYHFTAELLDVANFDSFAAFA